MYIAVIIMQDVFMSVDSPTHHIFFNMAEIGCTAGINNILSYSQYFKSKSYHFSDTKFFVAER